jgi:hypothetical protein
MATCRSKGVFVLLAFQDIAQIRQIYREGEDDKWLAMLGVRIFGQVKGGASQDFVLKQIGRREIFVPSTTITQTASGSSTSTTYQRTEIEVMSAHELEKLGPQENGVKAIVLGHGVDVLELEWSYYSPPDHRPAKVAIQPKKPIGLPKQSAPDVPLSDNAGDDDSGEMTGTIAWLAETKSPEATTIEKTEYLDDTDFLPPADAITDDQGEGLGLSGDDNDGGGLADDIAQDHIVDAVSEDIGIPSEPLSVLLKIADEASGSVGFSQTQTPIVVSKKKARRRKVAESESEAST